MQINEKFMNPFFGRGKSPKVAPFLFLGHKIVTNRDIETWFAVLKRSFHWEQFCRRNQCHACCEKKVTEVFVNTPFFLHKEKKSPKVDHFLFINFLRQNR